ncbi:ferredoxin [Flindersiella endophytica]
MRIRVRRELCASSGMCALTAPDLFDQDEDDGRVVLREGARRSDFPAEAREAVLRCPSGALALEED